VSGRQRAGHAVRESDRRCVENLPGSEADLCEKALANLTPVHADELPTLFDEYRQVEGSESSVQKGTGLGLSITKKFAELLGGSIGVESEIGKGSTFTVRVPVEYQEPA
jgi:light-regulated signal transduction histidine kinase (bacteriophytochrome)